jgi:hypothetical protein
MYESIMWSKARHFFFRGRLFLANLYLKFDLSIGSFHSPSNLQIHIPQIKYTLMCPLHVWKKKKKNLLHDFFHVEKKSYNLEPKPILQCLTLENSSKITNSFFEIVNHGWIWVSSITTTSVFLMLNITFGDKGHARSYNLRLVTKKLLKCNLFVTYTLVRP